jgi:hypothetical protein
MPTRNSPRVASTHYRDRSYYGHRESEGIAPGLDTSMCLRVGSVNIL